MPLTVELYLLETVAVEEESIPSCGQTWVIPDSAVSGPSADGLSSQMGTLLPTPSRLLSEITVNAGEIL